MGKEHEFVEDVNPQTLIKLINFLKRGKAPGPDTIHNEVFRPGTTTSLFHRLALGTESKHFYSNHFDEVNKFIEDNHKYFYPPEDSDYHRFDVEMSTSLWRMSTLKHSLS